MIYQHNGIAVNLYSLKVIRIEKTEESGYLVFEFDNAIIAVLKDETDELLDGSYRNEPFSQYYEDIGALEADFKIWVDAWNEAVIS